MSRFLVPALLLAATLAVSCRDEQPSYDVAVNFSDRYTEASLREVDAVLRSYDAGIDVLVQESFPPVARTAIKTGVENFCDELREKLEPRDDVADVYCEQTLG